MWGYQSNQIPVPNPERQLNNPAHLWNNKVDCFRTVFGSTLRIGILPNKDRPMNLKTINDHCAFYSFGRVLILLLKIPSAKHAYMVISTLHPFQVAASLNFERKGQDLVASQGRGTCRHCQKSFVHGAWPWKAGERAGCLQRSFWDSYAWHFLGKPLQDFGPKGWLHILCFPDPGRLHSPIQSGKRPRSAQRPEAVTLWTKLKPRPSINLIQVRCFKIWYRHRKAIEIGFRAPNFFTWRPLSHCFSVGSEIINKLTPWCFGLGHVATRFPKNARLNLLDALASRR